jgi:hypothetical protein
MFDFVISQHFVGDKLSLEVVREGKRIPLEVRARARSPASPRRAHALTSAFAG